MLTCPSRATGCWPSYPEPSTAMHNHSSTRDCLCHASRPGNLTLWCIYGAALRCAHPAVASESKHTHQFVRILCIMHAHIWGVSSCSPALGQGCVHTDIHTYICPSAAVSCMTTTHLQKLTCLLCLLHRCCCWRQNHLQRRCHCWWCHHWCGCCHYASFLAPFSLPGLPSRCNHRSPPLRCLHQSTWGPGAAGTLLTDACSSGIPVAADVPYVAKRTVNVNLLHGNKVA